MFYNFVFLIVHFCQLQVGVLVGAGFPPTGQGIRVAGLFIHVVVVGEGGFLIHLVTLRCHILNFMVGGLMEFEVIDDLHVILFLSSCLSNIAASIKSLL